VLRKDACYHAAGLIQPYLEDGALDFCSWFQSTLTTEAQSGIHHAAVLQRRVVVLLGIFSSHLNDQLRATAYANLATALSAGSDLVVMLTAVDTLMLLLCDADFDVEEFAPHAPQLFQGLFSLFPHLAEGATLMAGIDLLTTMLGMLAHHAAEVARVVAVQVPALWEQADTEGNAVKGAIIQAVTTLVQASGEASEALGSVAVPMIRFSINEANPDEVVFGEDGLALWRAAVCSLARVPGLFELFPELITLMRRDSSSLPQTLAIVEGYVLVGREPFLQAHGLTIAAMVEELLGTLRDKAALQLLDLPHTMLREFGEDAARLLARPLGKMLEFLRAGSESLVVEVGFLEVLVRVWLSSPQFYLTFLTELTAASGVPASAPGAPPAAFFWVVDAILQRFARIKGTSTRRILACALCSVASAPGDDSLRRLPEALGACAAVLQELDAGADPHGVSSDVWVAYGEPDDSEDEEAPGDALRDCKAANVANDALLRVDVAVEVSRRLEEAVGVHGSARLDAALSGVDPSALALLKRYPAVTS